MSANALGSVCGMRFQPIDWRYFFFVMRTWLCSCLPLLQPFRRIVSLAASSLDQKQSSRISGSIAQNSSSMTFHSKSNNLSFGICSLNSLTRLRTRLAKCVHTAWSRALCEGQWPACFRNLIRYVLAALSKVLWFSVRDGGQVWLS